MAEYKFDKPKNVSTHVIWEHLIAFLNEHGDDFGKNVKWSDILEKPLSFQPSTHTHSYNELTDKPDLSQIITTADLTNQAGIVFPTLAARLNDKYNYGWDFNLNVLVRYYFKTGAVHSERLINNEWVSDFETTVTPPPVTIYGQIVVSTTVINTTEGQSYSFTVKLSQAPTNNQEVILTCDNTDISLSKTSLVFTPTNFNDVQTVGVSIAEDTDQQDEVGTITLSSLNVANKTVTVNITDNDKGMVGDTYTVVGVKSVVPPNPFTTSDLTQAKLNVDEINRQLQLAYTQGFRKVRFEAGNYNITYPVSINLLSDTEYDFAGATFRVLYNSDIKHPFDDAAVTGNFYEFPKVGTSLNKGKSFVILDKNNVTLKNLKLYGDRKYRSFANVNEKNVEWTTGVSIQGTSKNIQIVGTTEIAYFMGDSIESHYKVTSEYNVTDFWNIRFEQGKLDASGNKVTGTTSEFTSTAFHNINSGVTNMAIVGTGYAHSTHIPSKVYEVAFYNSSNVFISKRTAKIVENVQIPTNAAKFKLAITGIPNEPNYGAQQGSTSAYGMSIITGTPTNIVYNGVEIHHNHRGGIFVGGDVITIDNANIHDSGCDGTIDNEGIPTFPDSTRYGITCEDNYSDNVKIRYATITNVRLGVAFRGYKAEIDNCTFNTNSYGVIFYYQEDGYVRNCSFTNSGFKLFNENGYITKKVTLTGNTFTNSLVDTKQGITVVNNNTAKSGCNLNGDGFDGFGTIEDSLIYNPISNVTLTRCSIRTNLTNCIMNNSYFNDSKQYTLTNCTITVGTNPLVKLTSPTDHGVTNGTLLIDGGTITITSPTTLHNTMCWGKFHFKGCGFTVTTNMANYDLWNPKLYTSVKEVVFENMTVTVTGSGSIRKLVLGNHGGMPIEQVTRINSPTSTAL